MEICNKFARTITFIWGTFCNVHHPLDFSLDEGFPHSRYRVRCAFPSHDEKSTGEMKTSTEILIRTGINSAAFPFLPVATGQINPLRDEKVR